MNKNLIYLPLLLFFSISCGNDVPTSSPKAVIDGNRDRYEVEDKRIGSLKYLYDETLCTVFAVSPTSVKTAFHCIENKPLNVMLIEVGGSSFSIIDYTPVEAFDMVELSIDGTLNAWFEQGAIDPAKPVSVLSAENDLVWKDEDSDFQFVGGVLFHSLHTEDGSSGSPIVQDGLAVAIHIGSLKRPFINVAYPLLESQRDHVVENIDFECDGSNCTPIDPPNRTPADPPRDGAGFPILPTPRDRPDTPGGGNESDRGERRNRGASGSWELANPHEEGFYSDLSDRDYLARQFEVAVAIGAGGGVEAVKAQQRALGRRYREVIPSAATLDQAKEYVTIEHTYEGSDFSLSTITFTGPTFVVKAEKVFEKVIVKDGGTREHYIWKESSSFIAEVVKYSEGNSRIKASFISSHFVKKHGRLPTVEEVADFLDKFDTDEEFAKSMPLPPPRRNNDRNDPVDRRSPAHGRF